MESEGVVYEGVRAGVSPSSVPPFPDSSPETLTMVAETLAEGQSARFEGASLASVIPEGCKWEVTGDIGTLTKLGTEEITLGKPENISSLG